MDLVLTLVANCHCILVCCFRFLPLCEDGRIKNIHTNLLTVLYITLSMNLISRLNDSIFRLVSKMLIFVQIY